MLPSVATCCQVLPGVACQALFHFALECIKRRFVSASCSLFSCPWLTSILAVVKRRDVRTYCICPGQGERTERRGEEENDPSALLQKERQTRPNNLNKRKRSEELLEESGVFFFSHLWTPPFNLERLSSGAESLFFNGSKCSQLVKYFFMFFFKKSKRKHQCFLAKKEQGYFFPRQNLEVAPLAAAFVPLYYFSHGPLEPPCLGQQLLPSSPPTLSDLLTRLLRRKRKKEGMETYPPLFSPAVPS